MGCHAHRFGWACETFAIGLRESSVRSARMPTQSGGHGTHLLALACLCNFPCSGFRVHCTLAVPGWPPSRRGGDAMDKTTEILIDALRQGAQDPGEHRLYRSGKLPGLFAARTGINADVAAQAIRDGYVEIVRSE